MRREFKWTSKQLKKLDEIKKVLREWSAYLPLTLRQIYYQLVSKEIIKNNISEYTMLSILLKWARINGHIGWDTVEDRVRSRYVNGGYADKQHFVYSEINNFLEGYRRHLMNDQHIFLEVWIEKDALSAIFSKLTRQYCVSTVVCRGFSSVTFLNDFKRRCKRELSSNRSPIMLYFGDFDPSGYEMLPAMQETLEDEMALYGVQFKRIALTKQDISDYNLPHDPSAVKRSDTRYQKFVDFHGEYAVELDALPPDVLEQKIRNALENEIDMEIFDRQKLIETVDIDELIDLKSRIRNLIEDEVDG